MRFHTRCNTVVLVTLAMLSLGQGLAWSRQAPPPPAAEVPRRTTPLIQKAPPRETWYTVSIGGKHAGYMHQTVTVGPTGITTQHDMAFSLKREAQRIAISTQSTFVEAHDSTPTSMRLVQSMGAEPTDTLYEFKPEGIQQTTVTSTGRQVTMLPPIAGDWLTPTAAGKFIAAQIRAGAKSFSHKAVDPVTGATVVTEIREELARGPITVEGVEVQTVRYKVTNSVAPGIARTEVLDLQGEIVSQEFNTGAFSIEVALSTKDKAQALAHAPEVMLNSYIVPSQPIRHPRLLLKAQYVLSVPEGEAPAPPSAGAQRSTFVPPRSVRVDVNAADPSRAFVTPTERTAYLASTTLADAKDAVIKDLVKSATKDSSPSPAARAEDMRRFVHTFIQKKDLSVGFASATQTARSRAGDCTEHGVLLAAMLRADGTPSRVVSGLVYIENLASGKGAFGYHLWTQALLNVESADRWIDLDPSLGEHVPFDASHIALTLSDLSDKDSLTSMVSIVPLLGRLSIEVVPQEDPRKSRDGR
jgi:Transglutaminase-like superfamily